MAPLAELYASKRVAQFSPRNPEGGTPEDARRRPVASVQRPGQPDPPGVQVGRRERAGRAKDPAGTSGSFTAQKGRTQARETDGVKPSRKADIKAALSFVTRPIRALVELGLATGKRPGEVVIMRACDIDMSDRNLDLPAAHHKTKHHGFDRVVFLGPKAQTIIEPSLTPATTPYLFRPADAVREARDRNASQIQSRRRNERSTAQKNPARTTRPKATATPSTQPQEGGHSRLGPKPPPPQCRDFPEETVRVGSGQGHPRTSNRCHHRGLC